jgi:hypothetical protein
MTRRQVSLSCEIEEVEKAILAARILCDGVWQNQFATEADMQAAPRAASAVLALVGQRLRLVLGVVQGQVSVRSLAAPHNTVNSGVPGEDDTDILLPIV